MLKERIVTLLFFTIIWFVLSGNLEPFYIICGIFSIIISIVLTNKLNSRDTFKLKFSLGFFLYLFWLIGEIAASSIKVAKKIWAFKLDISPSSRYIETKLVSPGQIIIYANSITLTPGTITLDIKPYLFLVHSLEESGFEDLAKGDMEKRISKI